MNLGTLIKKSTRGLYYEYSEYYATDVAVMYSVSRSCSPKTVWPLRFTAAHMHSVHLIQLLFAEHADQPMTDNLPLYRSCTATPRHTALKCRWDDTVTSDS